MNKRWVLLIGVAVLVGVCLPAGATTEGWYRVTFTGNDLYQWSAGAKATALEPRRYRPDGNPAAEVNTWTTIDDVATWVAANQDFGLVEFNLWGAATPSVVSWGVNWHVAGTGAGDYGLSSWKLVSAPTGWTQYSGIVTAADLGTDGAAPVWRLGPQGDRNPADWTGTKYTFADHANASWTFDVLVSDTAAAIDSNGDMRVWFGGYDDTWSDTGYTQWAGVMTLHADPIPEPLTMLAVFGGVCGLGGYIRRRL